MRQDAEITAQNAGILGLKLAGEIVSKLQALKTGLRLNCAIRGKISP
jgi:hypothetical protein